MMPRYGGCLRSLGLLMIVLIFHCQGWEETAAASLSHLITLLKSRQSSKLREQPSEVTCTLWSAVQALDTAHPLLLRQSHLL